VTFGQLLYGGDDLSGDEWDGRKWQAHSGREKLFWLAAEAVLRKPNAFEQQYRVPTAGEVCRRRAPGEAAAHYDGIVRHREAGLRATSTHRNAHRHARSCTSPASRAARRSSARENPRSTESGASWRNISDGLIRASTRMAW